MHTSLVCSLNGDEYPVDQLQRLSNAGKPLLARYDLQALRSSFTPESVRHRSIRSMWRFHEVLPVDGPDEAISLGEGLTPLLPCREDGPFDGFRNLFVKDESLNPTASFKARGMSAAITRAHALGVTDVALPSAGNAAGAAAYYAAKAGMGCHVFVPEDTPQANITEAVVAGANVYLVNGLINDCGKLVGQACQEHGWFPLSTLKEPFRLEGKKTMGYELAFDLADASGSGGLELPDVILYPTGGGTGLIGMWKAFNEMEQLGWIGSERPRMVVVQAENCCPIVTAFQQGEQFASLHENASTCASGLRVPAAVGDFIMLNILKETGGTAVTVSDNEMLDGVRELARHQGIYAAPEGGAVWKATLQLAESGWLGKDEKVVMFNTGSALKYDHLLIPSNLPRVDHLDPNWMTILAD